MPVSLVVSFFLLKVSVFVDMSTFTPRTIISISHPSSVHIIGFSSITEIKNKVGEGGSDPIVQTECNYVAVVTLEEVLWHPMGLNSLRVSEFQFSYFMFCAVPPELYGISLHSTHVCTYNFAKKYKV
jgi:hypothetical protein